MQVYFDRNNFFGEIVSLLREKEVKSVLLVCGNSFLKQRIYKVLAENVNQENIELAQFSGFSVNPKLEEAESALSVFNNKNCNMIIGAGGGSALDVAKYVAMKTGTLFLAIPTTAGTGSEVTPFSVLYKNGEKISVSDEKGLPAYVLLDGSVLKSLPLRQKKATMCDALSHAVESIWSVNSTEESMRYAEDAIRMILDNKEGYLSGNDDEEQNMLEAANLAGKAIAISKTTASHAMAYKMTTMFGFSHGEAVMLTLPETCRHLMMNNREDGVSKKLDFLKGAFDVTDHEGIVSELESFRTDLDVNIPDDIDSDVIGKLCDSVNTDRLSNYPVKLSRDDIKQIYEKVLICR